MSTIEVSDRFTALADDQTLAETAVALEEHGISVEVVDDLDTPRAKRSSPASPWLLSDDQHVGHAAGDRDRRGDRRRRFVRLRSRTHVDARLHDPRRSSCPTFARSTSESTSTASRSRTPAPSRPTARTAESGRSLRSIKRILAGYTSSSSAIRSGSDDADCLGGIAEALWINVGESAVAVLRDGFARQRPGSYTEAMRQPASDPHVVINHHGGFVRPSERRSP